MPSLTLHSFPFPTTSHHQSPLLIRPIISQHQNPNPLPRHRAIGSPEPPWLVDPPTRPTNPFPTPPLIVPNRSGTGIPFSIRFLQMRKKRLALTRPPPDLNPASHAVWSLACMLETLQRTLLPSLPSSSSDSLTQLSADTARTIVWLFQRVFSASPNLANELLLITSHFIVSSTEHAIPRPTTLSPAGLPSPLCWRDIGILEQPPLTDHNTDYQRKRKLYEHLILTEEANSLILSNYAQLLYQYENDFDRAEDYFRWAVKTEPIDGEVRSRYAHFLWEARGDIEGAEEMFLEAIEADPGNYHHHSNYSIFIWKTGGTDTCFLLEDCSGDGSSDCSSSNSRNNDCLPEL